MRLTYKYENDEGYGSAALINLPPDPLVNKLPFIDNAWKEQRNKLGQHEDIEEELGIGLVTLFKALKNGIWVKTKNGISKYLTVALKKRHHTKEYWLFYRPYSHVYLKDYGKTWALTKEELEK